MSKSFFVFLLIAFVCVHYAGATDSLAYSTIQQVAVTANTGEKPQSKVWTYDGRWWAVLANSSGTAVWRLDGTTWTSVLSVSSSTASHADAKVAGSVVHILLYQGTASELVSVEYVPASSTYQLWSARSTAVPLTLDAGVETATIDIDSQGRMWLASDASTDINVRWSDSPYSTWSSPVTIASGISTDDISVVTALPSGKIGVFWSNQSTQRFGFRTHDDGASPATWSSDEVPASQSALSVGLGMADDHMNIAVASDGTLYVAVKTSYDTPGYPKMALLVRRPAGTWDNLYGIDEAGTRPIILLNEARNTLKFAYTAVEGSGDIVYRNSDLSPISFNSRQTVLSGSYNETTSTKQNYTDQLVILATNSANNAVGVLGTTLAPDAGIVGHYMMDEGSGTVLLDSSGLANNATLTGSPSWVSGIHGSALSLNGTTQFGQVPDNASLDLTGSITLSAWIKPGKVGTQYIIKKSTTSPAANGYELSLSSAGRVFVRFNEAASGNTYRVNSLTPYPTTGATWMHVAATYDGATMKMYINGVLDSSKAVTTTIIANNLTVGIGAQSNGALTSVFQGQLDDARIYGRALSDAEILALASHTIVSSSGLNGIISPVGDISVRHGLNQSFTITAATGHHVDSLIVDGVNAGALTSYTFTNVSLDHTIRSVFAPDQHTVTTAVVGNGSVVKSPDQPTYAYGTSVQLTANADAGWSFGSWSGDLTGSTNPASVPINGNKNITATFINIPTHVIVASAGANGSIAPNGSIVVYEAANQSFSITPSTGYHVDSLLVDGAPVDSTTSYTFINVTAGHTIRAVFAINTYALNVSIAGSGSVVKAPDQPLYTHGTSVNLTATPQPGWVFDGWSGDATGMTNPLAVLMNANKNITATFSHELAGYWAMDEGSGTILVDSSANGNNATLTGSPGWTAGKRNAALLLNGTTQYGLVSDNTTLDIANAISLVAWVRPAVQNTQNIIKKAINDNPSGNGYELSLSASTATPPSKVFFRLNQQTSGNTYRINSTTTYPSDGTTWMHVAATYDGTTMRLYINGVLESSIPATVPIATNALALGVGASPDGAFKLQGAVDEARVYRRALTQNEISALMNPEFTITSSSGPGGTIAPLGPVLVPWGTSQRFTTSLDAGYHLDSLIVDGVVVDSTTGYTFSNVIADHTIRAVYAITQYEITASAGVHGSITPSGVVTVNHGSSQSFDILPDAGYHVDSLIVDGVPVTTALSYTFTNVTTNHDIRAVFAIDLHTITSSAGTNGSISPLGAVLIPHGSDQIYTITPGTGYHIDSLIVDGISVPVDTMYTFTNVTVDHTIRAVFEINQYIITATAGPNGAIAPSGSVPVVYGANRTFSFTPDTGYHIDSVFVDGVYIGVPTFYTFNAVVSNRTIHVTFAIDKFTITASAGTNGSIAPSGAVVVDYGSNKSFVMTPAVGYYVSNILIDGVNVDSTTSYTFINITANHTIRATFALSQYVILATAGPNGSINPAGNIGIGHGESQTFTFTPNIGYHIDSVIVDGVYAGSSPGYTFTNVISNRTIHVTFRINQYTISATSGPNGSIAPPGDISVLFGGTQTFTMTANALYHVDSVIVDGVMVDSTTSFTFVNVDANHTIRAVFRINAYPITVTAGPNGTITPPGVVYVDHGSSAIFDITPDNGYLIDSVFVDGSHVGHPAAYTFSSVVGPHALSARFRADLVLQVFPATDTIPDGEVNVPYNFSFQATGGSPAYTFSRNHSRPDVSFSTAGVLSGTPLTGGVDTTLIITVTDSRSEVATATYKWHIREPLRLTVVGNGTVQTSPDRSTFRHGESVILTAVPGNEQWDFTGWSGGASGTTNPISVVVPNYGNLTAMFNLDTAYLRTYRTVPYDGWAREVDTKGKLRGIKKKPNKVDFSFLFVNDMPEATTLIVDFSIPVVPESMHTDPAYSCKEIYPKAKRVSFCFSPGLAIGETVIVSGRGIKGSFQKMSSYYWQRVDPILGPVKSERKKIAVTLLNVTRFPMPNLHNVGEELFVRSAFPIGLRIGIPQDVKGAQSVVHLRYRDVLTSMAKKSTLHTGQPRCMAGFDNGTTIAKQQKSLPYDKHNNILFASAMTLKLNITASVFNQFPNGFGELTFFDANDPTNPLNGRTVSKISLIADSMLSCMVVRSVSPQPTIGQLFNVIDNILRSFTGPVDTIAFAPWTLLKGVRPLMDIDYLHPTSGLEPMSILPPAEGMAQIPQGFALEQNYPNPFNPVTTIQFSLPMDAFVTLKVYNILGQEVAVLADREFMEEGVEELEFDASNLASGVYFYQLMAEEQIDQSNPIFLKSFTTTRKMLLVK